MGNTHSIYHIENLIYETLWMSINLSYRLSGRVHPREISNSRGGSTIIWLMYISMIILVNIVIVERISLSLLELGQVH